MMCKQGAAGLHAAASRTTTKSWMLRFGSARDKAHMPAALVLPAASCPQELRLPKAAYSTQYMRRVRISQTRGAGRGRARKKGPGRTTPALAAGGEHPHTRCDLHKPAGLCLRRGVDRRPNAPHTSILAVRCGVVWSGARPSFFFRWIGEEATTHFVARWVTSLSLAELSLSLSLWTLTPWTRGLTADCRSGL